MNDDNQQSKKTYNCDSCSKIIPSGKEKRHSLFVYQENTSIVSKAMLRLLCPLCFTWTIKELKPNTTLSPEIETAMAFNRKRFEEDLERSDKVKEYLKKELAEDWGKHLKDEVKKGKW